MKRTGTFDCQTAPGPDQGAAAPDTIPDAITAAKRRRSRSLDKDVRTPVLLCRGECQSRIPATLLLPPPLPPRLSLATRRGASAAHVSVRGIRARLIHFNSLRCARAIWPIIATSPGIPVTHCGRSDALTYRSNSR